MMFGEVDVVAAEGAILAHSVAVGTKRLRKGRWLSKEDVATLVDAGVARVTVARLEEGDVHEDQAAARLARALVSEGCSLDLQTPHTGRVNVLATEPGLADLDAAAIHAVNAVHPMITVATVPEWQRMERGGMVATIKIISYAVPEAALAEAEARAQAAIGFRDPVLSRPVLLQTTVAGDDGAKGHEASEGRLAALGLDLGPKTVVPHDVDALAEAIKGHTGADLILILTGSATSDLRDVAPEAVRAAGGEVVHYGMPVDPGNLLFLGHVGSVAVIGLPGCARSPALNGADWVTERIICGVPVTAADIMGMGGRRAIERDTNPSPT